MQQGWLVLTRFRCVPNIQNMTENDFLFCFVLIIHDSDSLKSMKAASTIESLLIKDLVVLRMCSSLASSAHVSAMNMAEGCFARNISQGSLSLSMGSQAHGRSLLRELSKVKANYIVHKQTRNLQE